MATRKRTLSRRLGQKPVKRFKTLEDISPSSPIYVPNYDKEVISPTPPQSPICESSCSELDSCDEEPRPKEVEVIEIVEDEEVKAPKSSQKVEYAYIKKMLAEKAENLLKRRVELDNTLVDVQKQLDKAVSKVEADKFATGELNKHVESAKMNLKELKEEVDLQEKKLKLFERDLTKRESDLKASILMEEKLCDLKDENKKNLMEIEKEITMVKGSMIFVGGNREITKVELVEALECAVCKEVPKERVRINDCGHINCCKDCVTKMQANQIAQGGYATCPGCRQKIRSISPVFL